jgi:hypothetical protein
MSVSAIGSSAITSPFYTPPVPDGASADPTQSTTPAKPKSQFRSDLATLIKDVRSGDMTSAQQALTAVQGDISAANAGYSPQSTSGGTQLPPDLQNLLDAVQKGDPTAAQSALTKLQADAPKAGGAGAAHGHHHHHHGGGDATDAGAASTSSSTATLGSTTADLDPASTNATTLI